MGCAFRRNCRFVHPDDRDWDSAAISRPPPHNVYRGGKRPRTPDPLPMRPFTPEPSFRVKEEHQSPTLAFSDFRDERESQPQSRDESLSRKGSTNNSGRDRASQGRSFSRERDQRYKLKERRQSPAASSASIDSRRGSRRGSASFDSRRREQEENSLFRRLSLYEKERDRGRDRERSNERDSAGKDDNRRGAYIAL